MRSTSLENLDLIRVSTLVALLALCGACPPSTTGGGGTSGSSSGTTSTAGSTAGTTGGTPTTGGGTPTPCTVSPPQAPDPIPPDFDYAPLAKDWCAQLAACGYDVGTQCEKIYLEAAANPPTGTPSPGGGPAVEEVSESNFLKCEQSLEGLANPEICLGEGVLDGEGGVERERELELPREREIELRLPTEDDPTLDTPEQ